MLPYIDIIPFGRKKTCFLCDQTIKPAEFGIQCLGTADAKITLPSAKVRNYVLLQSFRMSSVPKLGVGQSIVFCARPTARTSTFLIFDFPFHSPSIRFQHEVTFDTNSELDVHLMTAATMTGTEKTTH